MALGTLPLNPFARSNLNRVVAEAKAVGASRVFTLAEGPYHHGTVEIGHTVGGVTTVLKYGTDFECGHIWAEASNKLGTKVYTTIILTEAKRLLGGSLAVSYNAVGGEFLLGLNFTALASNAVSVALLNTVESQMAMPTFPAITDIWEDPTYVHIAEVKANLARLGITMNLSSQYNSSGGGDSSLGDPITYDYIASVLEGHNTSVNAHADIRQDIVDVEQALDNHKVDANTHADIRENINALETDINILQKITFNLKSVKSLDDGEPDLLLNNGPLSGGMSGLPIASDEIKSIFSTNRFNVDNTGICIISPPIESTVGFVAPSCPNIVYNATTFRAIPVEINTNLKNTSISFPLFRPIKTNGWGYLVFKYIGEKPLYTELKGNINVLIRNSTNNPSNVGSYMFNPLLRLRAWETPSYELYPTKDISTSVGTIKSPEQFKTVGNFADYNRPVDASAIAAATTNLIFPGYVLGSISVNSTSENLTPTTSGNVRTTNWLDVTNYVGRALLFVFTGTSSVSRIQIKRVDGTIYYSSQSADITSNRIFSIPADAAFIRINYSIESNSILDETFKILTISTGGNYDYLSGYWQEHTLNVSTDFCFYPNAEYALNISGYQFNGALAWDFGYRFLGGSIQFEFDAKDMLNKLASNVYKG